MVCDLPSGAHDLEELLGLLPRHLLVSPTQGSDDDGDDAPARRAGVAAPKAGAGDQSSWAAGAAANPLSPWAAFSPSSAAAGVGSSGAGKHAGASLHPQQQPATHEDHNLSAAAAGTLSLDPQRVLAYLAARGKAAQAAHAAARSAAEGHGARAGAAATPPPCHMPHALSAADCFCPRSPPLMAIGPLPRAPPGFPRTWTQSDAVAASVAFGSPAWLPRTPHGAPEMPYAAGGNSAAGLSGLHRASRILGAPIQTGHPFLGCNMTPPPPSGIGPPAAVNAAAAAAMAAATWGWATSAGGLPPLAPPTTHDNNPLMKATAFPAGGGEHAPSYYQQFGGGGQYSSGLFGCDAGGDEATGLFLHRNAAPPPSLGISRNLWLGNVMVADAEVLARLFRPFGPLESVRVFQGRTYAFVNFLHEVHAAAAKAALEMQVGGWVG